MGKRRGFTPLEIKVSNRASKRFLTGFTLVELLVVIAIIAILMAILLPALRRVKKQTKGVICRSNLHQWSFCFSMYASDNNGYFPEIFSGIRGLYGQWAIALNPYYGDQKRIWCCPTAQKPTNQGAMQPFAAWPVDPAILSLVPGNYGSYGINAWVYKPPSGTKDIYGYPAKDHWRTHDVGGASSIPLFLDCMWRGGHNLQTDVPQGNEDDPWSGENANCMQFFCMNRHNEKTNGVFLDYSAREIGLKELWKLKWHRGYKVNDPPPVWPEWMKGFRDY